MQKNKSTEFEKNSLVIPTNQVKGKLLKFLTFWCLGVSTFFSGFLAFYFIKMWIVSIELAERSQGADEILLWIPQTGVALGSIIFFICIIPWK